MICDLSGVAGRDPLHVNKPVAAVAAHPPPPLVFVVDHKSTTHISSSSPTYCPPTDFGFRIFNIMMIQGEELKFIDLTLFTVWKGHNKSQNYCCF